MFNWFKRQFTKNKNTETLRVERKPWVKVEQTEFGTRYWRDDGTYMDIWDLIPDPGFTGAYINKDEKTRQDEN